MCSVSYSVAPGYTLALCSGQEATHKGDGLGSKLSRVSWNTTHRRQLLVSIFSATTAESPSDLSYGRSIGLGV